MIVHSAIKISGKLQFSATKISGKLQFSVIKISGNKEKVIPLYSKRIYYHL